MKNSIGVRLTVLTLIVGLCFISNCSTLHPKKMITPEIKAFELKKSGANAVEVAQELTKIFGLDKAGDLALILKKVSFNAIQIADMLEKKFNMELSAVEGLLEAIGCTSDEIFGVTSLSLAIKFAPQLRFDSGKGTCSGPETYPMAAQEYYQKIVKTGAWKNEHKKLQNNNPATIRNNVVPTYWRGFQCGKNQVRLEYWWFYGYQHPCDCVSGAHNGDWERVVIILSEDKTRVAAITYWQHSGWYTRFSGERGFDLYGNRPVVYVGRANHGSYHNKQSWAQTCCYWEDHRDGKGVHMNSWLGPLIKLQSPGGEEWMNADAEGNFRWGREGVGNHPIKNKANCSMKTCKGGQGAWGCHTTGCYQQQCEPGDRDTGLTCWHCARGYTDCGAACAEGGWENCMIVWKLHKISTYGKKYTIPNNDIGLTRTDTGW
jgi:hypothetical protein